MTTITIKTIDTDALLEAMSKAYKAKAEAVGKAIEKELQGLLSQTLHTHAWDKLKVATKSEVRIQNGQVYLIVFATVTGNADQKRIYNFVNYGTPNRVQTRTSPRIPERRENWTSPNSLALNHAGFTGNFFVIRAGTLVKGIPARNFYRTAVNELSAIIAGLRIRRWSVRRHEQ